MNDEFFDQDDSESAEAPPAEDPRRDDSSPEREEVPLPKSGDEPWWEQAKSMPADEAAAEEEGSGEAEEQDAEPSEPEAAPDAPRDWDATTYDRVADPQEAWGREVLTRLELRGNEVVLDAGCGTGRVTRLLAEKVPNGKVIGVDASPSMIEVARESLGPDVELIVADLTELELAEPVDLVFSTATFHWILDHKPLYRSLHGVMKPGARLVAQCGGVGNVAAVRAAISQVIHEEPFAEHFLGVTKLWNFPTPEDETQLLLRAGFTGIDCWLERKTIEPPDPRKYLETVCLGAQLDRLPQEQHRDFVARIASHMPDHEAWMGWTEERGRRGKVQLEYVRLNILALRP